MTLIADYALPAIVALGTLGALVMCVLVFRYGLPRGDEDPEESVRLVLGLRFGHALAAVGFALAALLAVVAAVSQPRAVASVPAPTAAMTAAAPPTGAPPGAVAPLLAADAPAGPGAASGVGAASGRGEAAAPDAVSGANAVSATGAVPSTDALSAPGGGTARSAPGASGAGRVTGAPAPEGVRPEPPAGGPRGDAVVSSRPSDPVRDRPREQVGDRPRDPAPSRPGAPPADRLRPAAGPPDEPAPGPSSAGRSRRSLATPSAPPRAPGGDVAERPRIARAEPGPGAGRPAPPVTPESDRPVSLPPRFGSGPGDGGGDATAALPAGGKVRRHRTTVRGVTVEVETRSAGAERVYVVHLLDAGGRPLSGAEVSLEGRMADGSLVKTAMVAGPEPGMHRARVRAPDGLADLRLRVAQPHRRFEVSLAESVDW